MHLHATVWSDRESSRGAKGLGMAAAQLRVVLDGNEVQLNGGEYVKYSLTPKLVSHAGRLFLELRATKDRHDYEVFSIPVDDLFQDEAGPRAALFRHLGEQIMLA